MAHMTNIATQDQEVLDRYEEIKKIPEIEITDELKAEVLDKIIVARVGLLLRHPFFGNMATRLIIKEASDWCPTAATDGRHLYYSVPFFAKMDNKEIEFVMGDEWKAGNLSYHLQSRPKWFNNLNPELKDLKIESGVIYVGNADILKSVCPGEFGSIKLQGICMIGTR